MHTYDYDVILIKSYNNYEIVTTKGVVLYSMRAPSDRVAMDKARAYMSSWQSVRIRTEDEYEKDKARDRMLESTAGANASDGPDPSLPKAGKPD